MFCNCKTLKSLPNLSEWNMTRAVDISSMFQNCRSLKSLFNISKWNIENGKKKDNLFEGCSNELTINVKNC